jgi:predicted nucleic acid-binding protein
MQGLVVADTGPVHYLILIGHIGVLPQLFGAVCAPATVAAELRHASASDAVRGWAVDPPPWFTVRPDPADPIPVPRPLDPGERAAIALAHALGAELLLIDDRAGVAVARAQGFRVTGTLGVLMEAARQGLLDLRAAFSSLRATNFHHAPALLDALLADAKAGR